MSTKRIAVITGVGPGTGAATARRLAQGSFEVAMLARNAERLERLAQEIPGCHAYPVDVTDSAALATVLDRIETELGAPEVVIHNAVGGARGTFLDIDPAVLEHNFQTNVMAFLHLARRFAPSMVAKAKGTILATGNTSAHRGKATFAGFAPTKAAQRILAESMARELGHKGIHVGYVVIDAVIDVEWARKMFADAPDDFFIKPEDIADEIWHFLNQPRGAWSFNVEIRPYRETW